MRFFKTLLLVLSINFLHADEFLFEPPKNFTLSPKYIGLHHPVKTDHVAAQLYFDQGLTFLYAFNHEAAYWSFIRATEIDPNMAMGYWGQALALGGNINIDIVPKRMLVAYETIQKALDLSKNSPEVEQAYINALKERYTNDPKVKWKELARRYYEAMKELNAAYPDDPDGGALYAESILNLSPWDQWEKDGKPKDKTIEALKALDEILINYPMHLGANHYYIHVIEGSRNPSQGLLSADRLKTLLPP